AAPRRNAEGFLTAPGMFSHDHADQGSVLLAAALAGRLAGRVADLGAGYGWLASQLLRTNQAVSALDLFEADHAALAAAEVNVTDPRARFLWADVARLGASIGPFDHVITNPPVHAGRALEPELGLAFLAAGQRLLARAGTLHVVANRQLPYEAALERLFAEWEIREETSAFKILAAHRPRHRPGRISHRANR
ncbi:MAG TPA: methyltransferase, partial [Paracoccaceae bacterium]|nr:methyltransferase [Paracoccaceae bacterium]